MALSWQTSIIFPFERGLHVWDNSLSAQTLDTHSYCCSSRVSLVAIETAAVSAVTVVSEWCRCRSWSLHDLALTFFIWFPGYVSSRKYLWTLFQIPSPPAQEVNSYLQYPKERSSPASWMDMAIRAPDRYASPWASVMKFDTRTINNERCIHGPRERTEEVLFQTAHRVFLYSCHPLLSWAEHYMRFVSHWETRYKHLRVASARQARMACLARNILIKMQLQVHKANVWPAIIQYGVFYSWYQYLESRVID